MYTPDDLLPISALQHQAFCERQCALIHIEQLWADNRFTAEGNIMHEKAHDEDAIEHRDGVRIERGMSLRSFRLGLVGKADVVEFHRELHDKAWHPFPVEYKRGRPKENNCDRIQLCAQAVCLEEMLGVHIQAGALFYGKIRRRLDVVFDDALRQETVQACARLHALLRAGQTPVAVYGEKCEACSLIEVCMPKAAIGKDSVRSYMKENLYG
jgi:CRISPR-associated exonuclease Cas4